MSTFKGRMSLYTNIALDRFDGLNLRCTAFFLSHCHKDHMVGLDDKKFENALKSRPGVFLYCTEITRLLLLADTEYMPLEPYIRTFQVGTEEFIKIPKDSFEKGHYDVKVTAVSAGHCPGSAMYLFEGDQGTSLYTGDFRWEMNYASTVSAFGTPQKPKAIDHLHIDTTFCVPQARHIPSRVECAEVTVSIVAQWLGLSPKHQVAFFCPARYGYEFLLREVAMRLDTKIHVSSSKVHLYDQIPDLAGLFTSDPFRARVHACSGKMRKSPSLYPPCLGTHNSIAGAGHDTEKNLVLNIRPCAMWFTTKANQAGLDKLKHVPASPRGLQRVCYSMHSSYSEIQDLVSYLQPQHVWPNVIPTSVKSTNQVQAHLDSFLEHSHPLRPNNDRSMERKSSRMDFKLNVPQTKPSFFSLLAQDSDSSGGCCFSSQDEPEPEPHTKADPARFDTNLEQDQNPCWNVEEEDEDPSSDEENVVGGTEDRDEEDTSGGKLINNDIDLHLSLSQDSEVLSEPHGSDHSPSLPFHNYESSDKVCRENVLDIKGVEGDNFEAQERTSNTIQAKDANIFNIFKEKNSLEDLNMYGNQSPAVLDGGEAPVDNSDDFRCPTLGGEKNRSSRPTDCEIVQNENCDKRTVCHGEAERQSISSRERNVEPKTSDMINTPEKKEVDVEENVRQSSQENHRHSADECEIIQSSPISKAKRQGMLFKGKGCKRPISPATQSHQTSNSSCQDLFVKSTAVSVKILPSNSISSNKESVNNLSACKRKSGLMDKREVAAQSGTHNQTEYVVPKRQKLPVENQTSGSSCKAEVTAVSAAVGADKGLSSAPLVISDDSSVEEEHDSDKLLQPHSQREKGAECNYLSGWLSKERDDRIKVDVVDLTDDS